LSILIALPGVVPAQVQITVHAGILTVAGERPMPAEFRAADIHRLEIPYGRFERRIELPPGRFEFDRQELINGCLLLNLRKL
jgi:HSP20 family molecular chaperone IbpA